MKTEIVLLFFRTFDVLTQGVLINVSYCETLKKLCCAIQIRSRDLLSALFYWFTTVLHYHTLLPYSATHCCSNWSTHRAIWLETNKSSSLQHRSSAIWLLLVPFGELIAQTQSLADVLSLYILSALFQLPSTMTSLPYFYSVFSPTLKC